MKIIEMGLLLDSLTVLVYTCEQNLNPNHPNFNKILHGNSFICIFLCLTSLQQRRSYGDQGSLIQQSGEARIYYYVSYAPFQLYLGHNGGFQVISLLRLSRFDKRHDFYLILLI